MNRFGGFITERNAAWGAHCTHWYPLPYDDDSKTLCGLRIGKGNSKSNAIWGFDQDVDQDGEPSCFNCRRILRFMKKREAEKRQ